MWEVAIIGILLDWPNLELDRLHITAQSCKIRQGQILAQFHNSLTILYNMLMNNMISPYSQDFLKYIMLF